jgi:hypothetical protein
MSIIYEATCSECGRELEVKSCRLDAGDDLIIEIVPCEDCISEAETVSYESGKADGILESEAAES